MYKCRDSWELKGCAHCRGLRRLHLEHSWNKLVLIAELKWRVPRKLPRPFRNVVREARTSSWPRVWPDPCLDRDFDGLAPTKLAKLCGIGYSLTLYSKKFREHFLAAQLALWKTTGVLCKKPSGNLLVFSVQSWTIYRLDLMKLWRLKKHSPYTRCRQRST